MVEWGGVWHCLSRRRCKRLDTRWTDGEKSVEICTLVAGFCCWISGLVLSLARQSPGHPPNTLVKFAPWKPLGFDPLFQTHLLQNTYFRLVLLFVEDCRYSWYQRT